jgi:hypothetical protein
MKETGMFGFNSKTEKSTEGRPMKTSRIRIEDISAIGEVLSEEHLRGVSGGCKLNGFKCCRTTPCGEVNYDM